MRRAAMQASKNEPSVGDAGLVELVARRKAQIAQLEELGRRLLKLALVPTDGVSEETAVAIVLAARAVRNRFAQRSAKNGWRIQTRRLACKTNQAKRRIPVPLSGAALFVAVESISEKSKKTQMNQRRKRTAAIHSVATR